MRQNPICCTCSDVLIADDDEFQQLFYRLLFAKGLKYSNVNVQYRNLKIDYSISGTEMCKNFSKMSEWDCDIKPRLAIIDYSLGPFSLDGVETALFLRENGFMGTVLLRTSDSKQDILKAHPELEELIEMKKIDFLISKNDSVQTKEKIQWYFDMAFN